MKIASTLISCSVALSLEDYQKPTNGKLTNGIPMGYQKFDDNGLNSYFDLFDDLADAAVYKRGFPAQSFFLS